jgi:pyruvate dehydrogenase E1 component alpha subunit
MVRIRLAEERIADMVETGEIRTPCHLYIGQEAIAAGICAALREKDYVWGGHRSHGHYLAKGGSLRQMFAELLGKATGCSGGRGGSMHLVAPEVGILGTVPLVAATIPLAVGAGLATRLNGDGRVSVSFFGDGAAEEGHFHESLNLAVVYRLPVVFVCENNLYSSHLHILERRGADNIRDAGAAHSLPGITVDGNDACAVFAAGRDAIARARTGDGPTLLECRTYRWRGHVGPASDMDVGVKRRDELAGWIAADPIKRMGQRLLSAGATPQELQAVIEAATAEIDEAVEFARASPYPEASDLDKHVFQDRDA